MAAHVIDKATCAGGVLLLAGSLGWAFWQRPRLEALRTQSAHAQLSGETYTPSAGASSGGRTEVWPEPTAQTRGPQWIYDVFTPPEIYYDPTTRQFSVTVPAEPTPPVVEEKIVPPFGVELVRIKLDTFRLQLIGYVGSEANFRGTFQNAVTGETFLGKNGRKVAELGLTIVSVQLRRERVEQPDGMPLSESVAHAVVRDDATGEETTLTTRERRMNGAPSAILRLTATGEEIEQKQGGTFTVGDSGYTVGPIQIEPPGIEITKTSPDAPAPETQMLTYPAPVTASPETAPAASAEPTAPPSPF